MSETLVSNTVSADEVNGVPRPVGPHYPPKSIQQAGRYVVAIDHHDEIVGWVRHDDRTPLDQRVPWLQAAEIRRLQRRIGRMVERGIV